MSPGGDGICRPWKPMSMESAGDCPHGHARIPHGLWSRGRPAPQFAEQAAGVFEDSRWWHTPGQAQRPLKTLVAAGAEPCLHLRPRAHLTLFMAAPTVAPCQSPSGPHPASLGLRDTRFSPPSWLTENPALAMSKCLSVLSATSFRHDL